MSWISRTTRGNALRVALLSIRFLEKTTREKHANAIKGKRVASILGSCFNLFIKVTQLLLWNKKSLIFKSKFFFFFKSNGWFFYEVKFEGKLRKDWNWKFRSPQSPHLLEEFYIFLEGLRYFILFIYYLYVTL